MKLHTILLLLGLLALFSVVASGFLYYSSLRTSLLKNTETQTRYHAEKIKSLISSYLEDNQKALRALAGLKELQNALVDPNEGNLSDANLILDHFNDSLKTSVSYLMDRDGTTMASSNRNDPESFVGKNYSFRPYFKEAIHKNPSIYLALGLTSKKRGVYYSHPVYDDRQGSPIGVVVLKADVDTIEREFINLQNYRAEIFTFITGPHGIVFMSDHSKFLYSLLWQASDQKPADILNSKQFGNGPWEWAGFKRKSENRAVDKAGNEYMMFQRSIESLPGWNVVHLNDIRALSTTIADSFIGTSGYIILVLCFLIGLSVYILYNIGKSDIIKRLEAEEALMDRTSALTEANEQLTEEIERRQRAEQTLRESHEDMEEILFSMPAGIMIIDQKTHKILEANSQAVALIGKSYDQIIGATCHGFVCPSEECQCPITDLNQTIDKSERKLLTSDGKAIPIIKSVVKSTMGGRECFIECFTDITEQKDLEQERLKKEKLQGVIETAGAVCHELNQPLQTILGSAELIMMNSEDDNFNFNKLKTIKDQVDRMGKITKKLMGITEYETMGYLDGKIIDINKASERNEDIKYYRRQ